MSDRETTEHSDLERIREILVGARLQEFEARIEKTEGALRSLEERLRDVANDLRREAEGIRGEMARTADLAGVLRELASRLESA